MICLSIACSEWHLVGMESGFIYLVSHFRPRTREVDLLDEFLIAHTLRSMIGIYHQSSASLISITDAIASIPRSEDRKLGSRN